MKTCSKCGKEKPHAEFRRSRRGGHHAKCMVCSDDSPSDLKRINVPCRNTPDGCRNIVTVDFWDPEDPEPRMVCEYCKTNGAPSQREINAAEIKRGVDRMEKTLSVKAFNFWTGQ